MTKSKQTYNEKLTILLNARDELNKLDSERNPDDAFQVAIGSFVLEAEQALIRAADMIRAKIMLRDKLKESN